MRLCISGGGTGGHLMIAQALCEAAIEQGHDVIFIGSMSGQDRDYFEKGSLFHKVFFLETTGVVNKSGFSKIKAIWLLVKAFFKSITILKENNIDAIYSVGGFSAAPASFASLALHKPLFIHEQNAVEGKLNSILKPYAARFISAYDKNSPLQGYPVREPFFETQRIRKDIKCVIFLGGSQGAKAINDLALSVAEILNQRGIKIIHQSGVKDFERVKAEYEKLNIEAEVFTFSKDIPHLMQKADLAISRSGASTLWELCANGLPAFFIPFPYAASDHQYYNAKFIVDNDFGWCARESEDLKSQLLEILDEDLSQKSSELIKHSHRGVAQEMVKDITTLLRYA